MDSIPDDQFNRHQLFIDRFSKAKRGRSNKEIARALCINPTTITAWTTGASFPRADTFLDLATLLDCDPHWLGGGDGPCPIRYDSKIFQGDLNRPDVDQLNAVLRELAHTNARILKVARRQLEVLVEAAIDLSE